MKKRIISILAIILSLLSIAINIHNLTSIGRFKAGKTICTQEIETNGYTIKASLIYEPEK